MKMFDGSIATLTGSDLLRGFTNAIQGRISMRIFKLFRRSMEPQANMHIGLCEWIRITICCANFGKCLQLISLLETYLNVGWSSVIKTHVTLHY